MVKHTIIMVTTDLSYIIASLGNVYDLVSSIIAYSLNYSEVNAWMNYVHNEYIALALAIIIFQLMITVIYVTSRYFKQLHVMNITLGLMKFIIVTLSWLGITIP